METHIKISLRTIQKFVRFINESVDRLNQLELDIESIPDKDIKMNESIVSDLKKAMKILFDSIGLTNFQALTTFEQNKGNLDKELPIEQLIAQIQEPQQQLGKLSRYNEMIRKKLSEMSSFIQERIELGPDRLKLQPSDIFSNNRERKFVYTDYGLYDGELVRGTQITEGLGIQVWDNGIVYEGWLKNNQWHGYGEIFLPNGDHYLGEFKQGQRTGFGTYYYGESQHKVECGWLDNKKNGQGTLYLKQGIVGFGSFKNDNQDGDWIISYPNGKVMNIIYKDGVELCKIEI